MLNGLRNVSYAESELMPAKQKEETYTVKSIIDKKVENKKVYYKIWWKGYLKKDATWEPKDNLIKDIPNLIKEYESNQA